MIVLRELRRQTVRTEFVQMKPFAEEAARVADPREPNDGDPRVDKRDVHKLTEPHGRTKSPPTAFVF